MARISRDTIRGVIDALPAPLAPPSEHVWFGATTGRVSAQRQLDMAKENGMRPARNTSQAPALARVALTTEEVRQVYGLTAGFLRRHPEIPRIKCGHRTIVFKVSDIEHFLRQLQPTKAASGCSTGPRPRVYAFGLRNRSSARSQCAGTAPRRGRRAQGSPGLMDVAQRTRDGAEAALGSIESAGATHNARR